VDGVGKLGSNHRQCLRAEPPLGSRGRAPVRDQGAKPPEAGSWKLFSL